MKTMTRLASGMAMILLFSVQADHRPVDAKQKHLSFLQNEQRALAGIRDRADSMVRFTGVQYAALQNYYMTVDPELLRVPLERLFPARMEAERRLGEQSRKSTGLPPMIWEEMDSDMGGRSRAVMWDPNDEDVLKVWAAGVTGGIWYRENIFDPQSRWRIVDDFMEGLAVSCLTYDPVIPETFYAGTGEGQTARIIYRESTGRGFGILKSTDGGESWSVLESTRNFAYVTDMVVREEGGKGVIYAAVSSGKYQGLEVKSIPSDGVYRSADGGQTWAQVLPNIPGKDYSYAPSDLEISAGGRIFAGTGISLDGVGGGNILYSDNGVNWTLFDDYVDIIENEPVFNYPGRVVLAASPVNPNRVYAALTAAGGDFYSFKSPYGRYILKSDDGGESWSETGMPEAGGGWAYIAWHALALEVNPVNPDQLHAGGLDLHKSMDGGSTWVAYSSWFNFNNNASLPNYVHADHHVMAFRPGHPDDLLMTTDGGIFLSRNATSLQPTVVERNEGFNTLQYYTCAMHPAAGRIYFFAGAQDNGTVRYSGKEEPVNIFDNVSYGDGTFCFIDENESNLQFTGSQFNYVYVTTDGLAGGMDFYLSQFQTGIFLNPADYDSKKNILYANDCDFYGVGADYLVRTFGFNNVPSANRLFLNTGTTVPFSAVKVSPHSQDSRVFVGTQDGKLFRVDNADYQIANPKMVEVTEIGSPEFPAGNIACVEVGKNDQQILVVFSNYGVPSVWETRDGGSTWANKEQNLPDMPVRWAVYHPDNPNQVLLATEAGVWGAMGFQTVDFQWEPLPDFPNVRVDMLRARKSDNAVLAATHGRGLWYSSSYPLRVEEEFAGLEELIIYPNPVGDELKVEINGISGPFDLYVYDMNGRNVLVKKDFIGSQEASGMVPVADLEPASYLLVLRNDILVLKRKFIISR